LGDDADPRLAAALAELDAPTASEAAAALARVDVLRSQQPFGFVHPLIHAAVYEELAPLERDAGHARAARLLADAGAEPERVAAHLLLVPPAGDSRVVGLLRDAARLAVSRGASESAADYLRRALAEPPAPAERAELLLELGSAEALVSSDAAVEHLREAHALIDEPIRRGETAFLLGRLLGAEEADAVFRGALQELAGADRELERLLEGGLIANALFVPSLHRGAVVRLRRVRGQPGNSTPGERMLLALLAFHDARAGRPAAVTVPLARRALAGGTLVTGETPTATFVLPATVLAMADLEEALTIAEDALADAHRRGSILTFAGAKVVRAQTLLWRGELAEAEAECRDALAASEAWGSWRLAGYLAAYFADALMEQGRLDDAAAALARIERGGRLAGSAGLEQVAGAAAHSRQGG
jgi:tetratricopeptide (TPR) repeat protein